MAYEDPSDALKVQSRNVVMTVPVPVNTLTHTQNQMFSLLFISFFCFIFYFNCFFLYIYKKRGDLNMLCLNLCYLRAGVHIREKVHFVVLCVFRSLNNTHL